MANYIKVVSNKLTFNDSEQTDKDLDGLVEGDGILIDEDDMVSNSAIKAPTQQSTKAYVTTSVATLKTALKGNKIVCMAAGLKIAGSSATLVTTDGTAAKCYAEHVSMAKTHWCDFPKFIMPDDFNGGAINISIAFRCAAASKKHSMGLRAASVASGSPHNPDLAAASQLYNEEVSDGTIGDVKIKEVSVEQAVHLAVAGQIVHWKFVVEDDAGADADAVLVDWFAAEWNKV